MSVSNHIVVYLTHQLQAATPDVHPFVQFKIRFIALVAFRENAVITRSMNTVATNPHEWNDWEFLGFESVVPLFAKLNMNNS